MNETSYALSRLSLGLTLFLTAWLTGCGEGPSLEDYLARAKDHRGRGDLSAAIIEAKNAVRVDPRRADARVLLGEIYLDAADAVAAEKELSRAVEMGTPPHAVHVKLTRAAYLQGRFQPIVDDAVKEATAGGVESPLSRADQAELAALRGHAYLGLRREDLAVRFYEQALALRPDEPDALLGKARVALARGRPEEARPLLNAATAGAPGFAPAWEALGDLEWLERHPEEAEKAYGEAIQRNRFRIEVWQKRASLRMTRGELDGADEDIQAMARLAPRNPVVNYTRGLLRLRQTRYEEAQQDFEAALTAAPDSLRTAFYLGAVYFAQGGLEQAQRHLERFLAANPASDPAASLLAVIALRQGNHERAATLLQAVERRNPADALTLGLLAKVRLAQGRGREAVSYLERAVSQSSQGTDAPMLLALSHLAAGRTEEGLIGLEEVAGLDPQLERTDVLLVISYMKVGEYAKATALAQTLREREPKNPLPLVLLGVAAQAQGDEPSARSAYEKALEVAPGNPSAAHNLALIARKRGDDAGARKLYEEVLAHYPGHLRTMLQLASLEASKGDSAAVERLLTQAKETHPDAVEPRVLLARHYQLLGRLDKALQVTRGLPEAVAADPRLLTVIAEAQLAGSEPGAAVETLETLVRTTPDSAQAHYLLAQAYAVSGRGDRVKAELREALRLEPDYFLAKVAMVRLAVQEGRGADADRLLAELETARPDDPEVTALKGWVAQARGRYEDAIAAYRTAQGRAPTRALVLELARAEARAGRPEEAIATLRGWLQQHPDDTEVRGGLASLYLALGRNDEALAEFQRLVQELPDNVSVLNNLAWLLREREPSRALQLAERAVELAPRQAAIVDTLALVLLDRGQVDRALTLLRQANEDAPGDLTIRYHLAMTLARSGDQAGARGLLQGILGSDRPFAGRGDAEALLRSLGD